MLEEENCPGIKRALSPRLNYVEKDVKGLILCVSLWIWGFSEAPFCANERSLIFRGDWLGHRARSRVKWGVC